jgi:hypothetical protein
MEATDESHEELLRVVRGNLQREYYGTLNIIREKDVLGWDNGRATDTYRELEDAIRAYESLRTLRVTSETYLELLDVTSDEIDGIKSKLIKIAKEIDGIDPSTDEPLLIIV